MLRRALPLLPLVLVAVSPACSCSSLLPGSQATIPCDGFRGERPVPDGGSARCSRLGEFGLACEEAFTQAGATDILWVVDNSGSMTEEIDGIRRNLNDVARVLTSSGLDFHMVLVSEKGTQDHEVCVPEPLAGPNCGNSDRFMHINQRIESNDGPQRLLSAFDDTSLSFQSFLRPGAQRSLVFVTDDNSDMNASAFLSAVRARPLLDGLVVHGIIGTSRATCATIAAEGTEYEEMTRATGGLVLPICCDQYGRIMDVLAQDMAAQGGRYVLERPAQPQSVRVFLDDNGTRTAVSDGWTYDEALHAVVFDAARRPGTGETIVVTYVAR